MSIVNIFNKNIIMFLTDLNNIVNDKHIKKNLIDNINNINSVLCFNKNFCVNKFYNELYKFKNDIMNENELVIQYLHKINFFDSVDIIHIWTKMKEQHRQTCWNYLKTFILLSEKIKNI
tara:strand:+ start:232 stop:588 length:357 start_codon:yes stop_codon:yes gene_type:complete